LVISFSLFVFAISLPTSSPTSTPTPPPPLDLSPEHFSKGVELFDDEQYEAAIGMLRKVDEEYENYAVAQDYIKEASVLLSHELLAAAKNYFSEDDYVAAIETATKAISFNISIENEANKLISKAEKEYEIVLAAQKRAALLEKMKSYEGEGSARVAVAEVISQKSFNDGFTTWTPKSKDSWYLLVAVVVANSSSSTLHVNPNFVTLICDKRAFNTDINSYAIRGEYLDAIDLQPGTYTSGWLLFLVPKADSYTLVYEGIFDKPVRKEIVVTQTK